MRLFLPLAAFSSLLITTLETSAQADRFAYAITDASKDGFGWNVIRKLDLQTGKYSDILLNGTDAKAVAFDALSKKPLAQPTQAKTNTFTLTPFAGGVAAMAYDRKHNRLYFTPMFTDQLRYVDLATNKLYYVTDQPFTKLGQHHDEGKIITRMVIAPDGNGYAVSNDGNTLIKFTTGKKLTITQLGELVDDPANAGISIHNRCSSFGGDMISDDKGNLFIVTARNHIFKVNTQTKIATHLGAIQNLPANFTVNGAVVDDGGNLLVSSAISNSAYYVVDMENLKAKPLEGMTDVFRSSDLANSNFLSNASKNKTAEIPTISMPQSALNNFIRIYPNPIVTNSFTLSFNQVTAGNYTVELTNVMGQKVLQQKVNIANPFQLQQIPLSASNAKGIYLVKVYNLNKKSVFQQKVMVQ